MKPLIIKISTAIFCAALLLGCQRQRGFKFPHLKFKTEVIVPHTSVKDQGQWPAGWIYATLSMIESERIKAEDSLQFSATFLERMNCEEIIAQFQTQGWQKKFEDFAGTPLRCIELAKTHGLLTYSCYRPKLVASWPKIRESIEQLPPGEQFQSQTNVLLDTSFAFLPTCIGLYGATYTSMDLMHSVLQGPYVADAMFAKKSDETANFFILGDAADAHYASKTPDEIISDMTNIIKNGHTLVWIGDTAIVSFSSSKGLALEPETKSFEPDRQQKYLMQTATQPLHALHIVGIARLEGKGFWDTNDDDSELYFIAKDSHGSKSDKKGYIYMSENFIKAHTSAIYHLDQAWW